MILGIFFVCFVSIKDRICGVDLLPEDHFLGVWYLPCLELQYLIQIFGTTYTTHRSLFFLANVVSAQE